MTLSERITFLLNKAVKEDKLISQVELANIMEISPASINKWMAGGSPSIDKLPKLCEVLGITPNELFDYYEQPGKEGKSETLIRKLKNHPKYHTAIENLLELIINDLEP